MQEQNETLQLEVLNNVERSRYELWRRQGEVLTTHGIATAPSHHSYKDEDGNARSYVSVWGAFHDAAELAEGAPVLMLATEVNPHNIVLPALPEGFAYTAVANQTTGVSCAHKYLVGIRLEVNQTIAAAIAAFSERDGHDCVGLYRHSLGELSAYNALLQSFGLSADTCWEHLAEACYPIDATDDNIRVLTQDAFPTSLMRQTSEDLSYANCSETRLAGLSALSVSDRFDMTKPSKWALFLLTENCD